MTGDPALLFWRHYAEREGALTDDDQDRTLMVLPQPMQQRFGLSETIAATSDPALAREEGALLMIPGHPILDLAAGHVLEEGDGGHLWLSWPGGALPSQGELVAAAREALGVDHGRIDAGGIPVPRYAPVLRVGVQVTYSVHDRFHEQEEVWVEALGGLPLLDGLGPRLAAVAQLHGRPAHPSLEPRLTTAVAAAHRLLDERATLRLQGLAGQVARTQADEQALADDYYRTALESIEQRRQAASPERQSLLDSQAAATRAEWARRRDEIQQKFEPQRQLRPVRLHLVWIPAMALPVIVRRGGHGFPFSLIWWLPTGGFAPVGCPTCGASAQLVAGRNSLGCRACQPPSLPGAPLATTSGTGRGRSLRPQAPTASGPRESNSPEEASAVKTESATADTEVARFALALDRMREEARAYEQTRRRVIRIGDNLGFSFWQAVVGRDSWPRKRADPDSPLRVLYRLYGSEGPLRAIGLPPGTMPSQSSSSTYDPEPGILNCTDGQLLTPAGEFSFSLRWRLAAGKPAVEEVLPIRGAGDARIAMNLVPIVARPGMYGSAPSPRVELDPVAAALWAVELPASGLPILVRCLAAWWRIPSDRVPPAPAETLAAAVAAVVGRRAGVGRSREQAAAAYHADPGEVVATARTLHQLLGLAANRWW